MSMIEISSYVGQSVGIAFLTTTGTTVFTDLKLYSDSNAPLTPGVISQIVNNVGLSVPVEIGIGTGVFNITFTSSSVGEYYIYSGGVIIAHIHVAAQSFYTVLKNIEDESLGSWSWNKATGALTMLRQTGVTLATYNVIDTVATSSRERLT